MKLEEQKKLESEVINIITEVANKRFYKLLENVKYGTMFRKDVDVNTSAFEKFALLCIFENHEEMKRSLLPKQFRAEYNGRIMEIPIEKMVAINQTFDNLKPDVVQTALKN